MMPDVYKLFHYVDQTVEEWVGWSRPPAPFVLQSHDWRPDPREAYCSRCGSSVGPGETTSTGCATCRQARRPSRAIGDGVVRLGRYATPLRQWVLDIKYQQWPEMAFELGLLLGRAVRDAKVVEASRTIVVPMPMPWQRRIYRGIHHAGEIARGVASALGEAPIVSMLTKQNGPPQSSLSPSQRAAGLGRRLRLRRRWGGWPVEGLDIVLVDDILTTGGSLRSAIRPLRRLRPRLVVSAVLSVADEASRRDRRTVAAAAPRDGA